MYFESFPVMYYDFVKPNGEIDYVLLKDITENIRFKRDVLQNIALYEEYTMRDGETPEIVSEKFYGTPFYHWIIMVANDKYDYINDYPLPVNLLEDKIKEKYGTNVYGIHHYVYNGYVVDEDYAVDFHVPTYSVSNYDYEVTENENKRRIKIITPALLETILQDFRRIV